MQNTYDIPTYPELGNIYPGDYYEALPYDEFIDKNKKLPEGKRVFDIRDFGARPEKDLLNTEAFLKAASACEKAGGGVILVAGGSYCMGTVYIPSHTTLFIAADSEIKASRNVDLLLAKKKEQIDDRKGESSEGAFVRVKNAEDVTITGGGRINGSGEWYVYEPKSFRHLFHLRQAVCQDVIRQKKLILFLEHSAIIIDREYVIQKINMVKASQI